MGEYIRPFSIFFLNHWNLQERFVPRRAVRHQQARLRGRPERGNLVPDDPGSAQPAATLPFCGTSPLLP